MIVFSMRIIGSESLLFFELLQVALGNRESLSRVPTTEEWEEIYEEAGRQAMTGILLRGIDRLPAEQRPSRLFLLQWIGEGQMIEQRNQVMDTRCGELLKMLKDYGIRGSILKGQGVALLYDKELRPLRQSGDIDVYVDCGIEKAMAFARTQGQEYVEYAYKHLQLEIWDDTEIEMHVRVEVLLNLIKNKKLQQWFEEHQGAIFIDNDNLNSNTNRTNDANGLVTPTVEFNAFYILLHIYRHFLYEGVGLRQIVDYYYVLKAFAQKGGINNYCANNGPFHEFGMMRFVKGVMWLMNEYFGMPKEWMLCEGDEKEGKYILGEIMEGGNFGHFNNKSGIIKGKFGTFVRICSHNLHLFSHYPADTLWAPLYFIWLKLWKIKAKMS